MFTLKMEAIRSSETPNFVVEWLALLLRIREVGLET
jgi:hypothetical protein